jgi:hypothetical protein
VSADKGQRRPATCHSSALPSADQFYEQPTSSDRRNSSKLLISYCRHTIANSDQSECDIHHTRDAKFRATLENCSLKVGADLSLRRSRHHSAFAAPPLCPARGSRTTCHSVRPAHRRHPRSPRPAIHQANIHKYSDMTNCLHHFALRVIRSVAIENPHVIPTSSEKFRWQPIAPSGRGQRSQPECDFVKVSIPRQSRGL